MGNMNAAIKRSLPVSTANSKSCFDNRIFMKVINEHPQQKHHLPKTFSTDPHLCTLYQGQPHCLLINSQEK